MTDWAVIGAVIVAGFLPNEIWRWAGVLVSSRVDEGSEILAWVRAVSTALLAGFVARLIMFPPGVLADTSLLIRVAAVAVGILAFFGGGRRMSVGVGTGVVFLVISTYLT